MKIAGVIFFVFAALNFIAFIVGAVSPEAPSDLVGQKLNATIMMCVIGGILYYNGKKKGNR